MTKITYIYAGGTEKTIISGTIANKTAHPHDLSRMVCSPFYKETFRRLEGNNIRVEGQIG